MYDVISNIDACVDLVLGPRAVPEYGRETRVDDNTLCMGGSASIFLSQTGRLGLRAAALGLCGVDHFGEIVIKTLQSSGVDTSQLKEDPATRTGLSVILQQEQTHAILTVGGCIDEATPADLPANWQKSARHLHIASPYLLTGFRPHWPEIAKSFKEAGGTVSLDPNWDPSGGFSGLDELMEHVTVLMPNEHEARVLGGSDNLEKALQDLAKRIAVVVVKRGGEGAMGITNCPTETTDIVTVPAQKVKVADTVGAGDSFDAGFIYGFLNGFPFEKCLRAGCVCGAGNVTAHGGTAGQPWREDFLKAM
ncbi:MAG: carbohydrate kinase family protein [Clostridia bacterium]|nr:carbohydrate kinase family protein [Clostridia bacterium]